MFVAYIWGLDGVEVIVSGGGCRADFWDFSSKKWFLAVLTCPNRFEIVKNGFYEKNLKKEAGNFIFLILAYIFG